MIGIGIGIPFKRKGSGFPAILTDVFLFFGDTSKITGGHLNNQVKDATDFLTVTGTGLTAVYETPDTDIYRTADTDNCWWKTNTTRSVTTGQRLVDYDFNRTIIKYSDSAPHVIKYIGILKSDAVLSAAQVNALHRYFYLSVFWSGVANFNGHFKANRVAAKSVWSAESVLDAATVALVARMTAAGETPTGARQTAMDALIVGLKAANLFGTRFDAFWVGRNTGLASSKMNWIQNAFNLTKGGAGTLTFTADVGYQGDGTTYLNTNLAPDTAGLLGALDDCSLGQKTSGSLLNALNSIGVYDGYVPYTGLNWDNTNGASVNSRLNANIAAVAGSYAVGYTAMSRVDANGYKFFNNANEVDIVKTSVRLPDFNIYLLGVNVNNTGMAYPTTNEVFEMGWYGKGVTPAEFATIKTLFNAYIAAL